MPTPYRPENPQTKAEPAIGSPICMCPTCKEWFGGERGFDKHRAGDYSTGRYCVNPADVGLTIKQGRSGSWWIRSYGPTATTEAV